MLRHKRCGGMVVYKTKKTKHGIVGTPTCKLCGKYAKEMYDEGD